MRGRALILFCLAGCADGPPGNPAGSKATSMEDLAAVGYASHDDQAQGAGGVVVFHAESIAPGWNLFTDQEAAVVFVDEEGQERWSFSVPGRSQVEHAEPVPEGFLTVSVDQGWDLFDRSGQRLWSLDGNAHHDVAARPGGGFYVLAWEERRWQERSVRFDRLLAVTAAGQIDGVVWSSFEARERLLSHHKPLPLDLAGAPKEEQAGKSYDYHHINTVEVLEGHAKDTRFAPGNLLLCARNANLVFVLEPETGAITWSFGPGTLDFPHTPSITPEGNLLIFDNGWHRGWSRAIEIEPSTQAVLWSFEATPRSAFFTKTRGSAQRLSNGNTLLCEAEGGRAFEVTPQGRMVWSFLNPLEPGSTPSSDHSRRRLYRMTRVQPP